MTETNELMEIANKIRDIFKKTGPPFLGNYRFKEAIANQSPFYNKQHIVVQLQTEKEIYNTDLNGMVKSIYSHIDDYFPEGIKIAIKIVKLSPKQVVIGFIIFSDSNSDEIVKMAKEDQEAGCEWMILTG